jgi:predicted dehydrogenase
MNPSPEEKDVGKVNFQATIGSKLVRRDFLMKGIKAGVSRLKGLGAMYYGYDDKMSEPVRVGVLGTGDEGSVLIGALNPAYVTVVSIADVRPYNQFRAFKGDFGVSVRPGLEKVYEKFPEVCKNLREKKRVYLRYQDLIAKAKEDGVEAVIIALPLHLHAPAAIAAMKAGLHVLTEKLMGHSVHECKEMARVSELTKRYLATGHQRHYSILYYNAMDVIERGLLGDLHYIRAQWHRGNLPGKDSWQQPMPYGVKPKDSLAGQLLRELKDYKDALVNAAEKDKESWHKKIAQKEAQIADEVLKDTAATYGYKHEKIKDDEGNVVYDRPAAEELIRWRLWDRTGGGLMAELGSHQLDAASLFISAMHGGHKQMPLNVMAAANRPLFPPDRDAEDHVYCLFEFPAPGYFDDAKDEKNRKVVNPDAKITVQYSSINGNGFGDYGETVLGSEGTLLLDRESEVLLYKGADLKSKIKVVEDGKTKKPVLKAEATGEPDTASVGQLGLSPNERGYTAEIEHWAWCIRNSDAADPEKPKPRCYPKVAMADAVIALTTNICARIGGRMDFDPNWFKIESDATPEGTPPDISKYE